MAICPDGKRVLSGGYIHATGSLGEVFINAPEVDATAWVAAAVNWADPEGTATDGELTAIAYCVPTDEKMAPYEERRAAARDAVEKLVAKYKATKQR